MHDAQPRWQVWRVGRSDGRAHDMTGVLGSPMPRVTRLAWVGFRVLAATNGLRVVAQCRLVPAGYSWTLVLVLCMIASAECRISLLRGEECIASVSLSPRRSWMQMRYSVQQSSS